MNFFLVAKNEIKKMLCQPKANGNRDNEKSFKFGVR